ncbi:MAG: hypothetical protein EOM37_05450 [Proteobacteria bacterium]|nr:hypothetical protein [Pseudomonadota bacterium]
MTIKDLAIVDPGGNITAVVFDDIPASRRLQINNQILERNTLVEQVLFVEHRVTGVHGQMAGGEFCGNAARSLGYLLAEGRTSQQRFTTSGISVSVIVEAGENRAKLLVDLSIQHEKRPYNNGTIPVVHLDGISHAVMFSDDPLYDCLLGKANEGKTSLLPLFETLGLLSHRACGLQLVEESATGIKLKPYVYVRAVDTLYAETACASGSIAVTSLLGEESHLVQPSGKILSTKIASNGSCFRADVDGYADLLSRGSLIEVV